ncbi:MAG: hypothetical protein ACREC4_11085 [Methylocella sp.]
MYEFFGMASPFEGRRTRRPGPNRESFTSGILYRKSHFVQPSQIATLASQGKGEVRLGDTIIRISGAWRAYVAGFGAWEPPIKGFGIAKIRRTWQFQS